MINKDVLKRETDRWGDALSLRDLTIVRVGVTLSLMCWISCATLAQQAHIADSSHSHEFDLPSLETEDFEPFQEEVVFDSLPLLEAPDNSVRSILNPTNESSPNENKADDLHDLPDFQSQSSTQPSTHSSGPLISQMPLHLREIAKHSSEANYLESRKSRTPQALITPIQRKTLLKIQPNLMLGANDPHQQTNLSHVLTDWKSNAVKNSFLITPRVSDQDLLAPPRLQKLPISQSPTSDLTQSRHNTPQKNHPANGSHSKSFLIQSEISQQRIFRLQHAFGLSLSDAMQLAVENSPELKALRADIIINNQEIIRQDAEFDFSHFIDTLYDQQTNPVGSNLDGAQDQLRNKLWNLETGLRKRNRFGGELSLTQQLGHLESNSAFINPNNQANSQIGIELEQPLARGATREVNESGINLARIATASAQSELRTEVQNRLLEIVEAYWDLVLERGNVMQFDRSVSRAQRILTLMENRQQVDVLPQQLIRARAAVARRESDLAQSRLDAQRAQERLMRLMFGDQYQFKETFEIVPTTVYAGEVAIADLESGMQFGLQNRPEIQLAMQDIQSAAILKNIARNELNPQLDLVFGVFGKGLQGNSDFGDSYVDQFSDGEPSFQVGFKYELPVGNRSARAQLTQRQMEISKFQNQLQSIVSNVAFEIRDQSIARARYRETVNQRRRALDVAVAELETIRTRRQFLLDGDQIANLYLDDLLQSQERVQLAEQELLETVTDYGVTQARWLRAIGALDQYDMSVLCR